jgi:hypothetical protein
VSALLLVALAACASPREELRSEPVCLPVAEVLVQTRVDGPVVRVETNRRLHGCSGAPVDHLEPLATITRPVDASSCPVGQVAARASGPDKPHEVLLPGFVAGWLWGPLERLAGHAEAIVIGCPAPRQTDWLLVETAPLGDERPRLALLVDAASRYDGRDARVAFWPALVPEVPEPRPAPPVRPPPPPCTASDRAPTWFGRHLWVGWGNGPTNRRTVVIGRSGTAAWLTIEAFATAKGGAQEGCTQVARLEGTVVEIEGRQIFRFAGLEEGEVSVTCRPRAMRVATSRAVRVAVPSSQEGCSRHRWKPAPSVEVRALECRSDTWEELKEPVFLAAGAGLEHVTCDGDDCWAPEEALRVIAPDRSVAPVH